MCVKQPVGRVKLRLFDETSLDGFYADPFALDCAVCHANANALHIGLECALCLLDELQTDTAALFALTFVNDSAAFNWTLACY